MIRPPVAVRWMLADGQGNTVAAVDPDTGGGTIQHFDAFGVALGTVALSGCRAPLRDRSGTGEYGYRGQEGYRTNLTDVDRPQVQGWREYGDEERSTGLMLLGARDYDPSLGRFVEADPLPVDPGAAMAGQANRWVYCANDPVNFSDPSGQTIGWVGWACLAIISVIIIGCWASGVGNLTLIAMIAGLLMGILLEMGRQLGASGCNMPNPVQNLDWDRVLGAGLIGMIVAPISFAINPAFGSMLISNLITDIWLRSTAAFAVGVFAGLLGL